MGVDVTDRRLAAIMALDVVGYSRMMSQDEVGTLHKLKTCRRNTIDPVIKLFRGRIVKSTGDGLLAEFLSAVDAITCAAAIQQQMAEDSSRAPDGGSLLIRIGLNLGDLIIEPDGDIFGDGVNVAARLEGLAPSGGVAISRSIFEQVRDRVQFPFVEQGEFHVKNIA